MSRIDSQHSPSLPSATDWDAIEAEEESITYGSWSRGAADAAKAKRWRWLAIGGIALAIGWAIWSGYRTGSQSVTTTDRTFAVVSDSLTTITFDVARPKNTELTCRLRASDDNMATVGTTSVQVPANPNKTLDRVTAQIRTSTRAVTATVTGCEKVGTH